MKFIDTHNRKRTPSSSSHVAMYRKPGGRQFVVPVYEAGNFCINPLRLRDGEVELRSGSVGPAISKTQVDSLLERGYLDLSLDPRNPEGASFLRIISEEEALNYLRFIQ